MNTKIDSMKSELSNKSLRIDRLVQDRDRTRGALDNLKVELTQVEREKNLDKREHQMELQEKNEEVIIMILDPTDEDLLGRQSNRVQQRRMLGR